MGVLIRKEEISEALNSPSTQGKRLIEPFKSFALEKSLPLKILEDSFVSDNFAEAHDNEEDLWLCLEGEPEFIYGGELVDRQAVEGKVGEWKAKEIRGGTTLTLKPGDWLWIPAGEPHQHNCPGGVARMIIIKIPVKK